MKKNNRLALMLIPQKKSLVILFIFGALCLNFSNLNAQTNTYITANYAVPFLRIPQDPISAGMGNTGLATPNYSNAPLMNIAKLINAPVPSQLGVNYIPWFKNIGSKNMYLASLSGYTKIKDKNALSIALKFFNLGSTVFTDIYGTDLMTYNPNEFSVALGYTLKVSKKIGLGVTMKYIYSNLVNGKLNGLDYSSGKAVAGDISFYYNGQNETKGSGFTFGATLSNMGSKISYTNSAQNKDYLPANLGLGANYLYKINNDSKLSFGIDLNKLLVPYAPALIGNVYADSIAISKYKSYSLMSSYFKSFGQKQSFSGELQSWQINIGAEYSFKETVFVRAGYCLESKDRGNRNYFTAGVGAHYKDFGLNVAYWIPTTASTNVSLSPLGNTIQVGLIFNLVAKPASSENIE